LLARLLDEVLPSGDGDRDDLRRRTADAMGVALSPNATLPPSPADAAAASSRDDENDDDDDEKDDQDDRDDLRTRTANATAPSERRRRRGRRLQQNATPLSPIIIPPTTGFTVNQGGLFGGYSQAFQIIFSNAFDFFLRGGLGFLVPVIGDVLAPLRRYNWVRDLGNAVDAPFDNVINANYVPLPQTTDDLVALALRVLAPLCAAERATAGNNVLGAVRGAVAEVELVPWSCDVVPNDDDEEGGKKDYKNKGKGGPADSDRDSGGGKDDDHADEHKTWRAKVKRAGGRQRIDWASCTPSKLVVRLKPATFAGPYYTSASYTAAACAFSQPFGFGSTVGLGLDSAAVGLKVSRIGVDLVPTIVQFEASGRYFPWLAAFIANGGAGPPAREVSFTSAANRTTGA